MAIAPATHDTILRAAKALKEGRLAAFPTETVYGLGANAIDAQAVASVYEMKGRPRFNPLIVHVADTAAAEIHCEFDERAHRLATDFWPGPLTLVLPRKPDSPVCDLVSAGLDTLAVRVPSNPIAQELLKAAGCPVAAPSANRAGHVSPTTAEHVAADLGDGPAVILDGGAAAVGLESTVIGLGPGKALLLRPGAIPRQDIERALQEELADAVESERPVSPGQLASHYAPRATLRLEAKSVEQGEALLAFGPDAPAADGPTVNLSPSGDLREAAIAFFAALRALDASGCGTIAVMPVPEEGLGEAINDRLRRAAAPR